MSQNTGIATSVETTNNSTFAVEQEANLEQAYAYLGAVSALTIPAVRALKIAGLGDPVGDRRTDLFKLKLPFQSLQQALKNVADAMPAPEGVAKPKSDLVYSKELAAENAQALTDLRKYLSNQVAPLIESLQLGDVEPSVELRLRIEAARKQVLSVNKVLSFIFDELKPEKAEPESEEEVEETIGDDDGI